MAEQLMYFPDPPRAKPRKIVGKEVWFDEALNCWCSRTIKIYTGDRKALRV